MKITTKIGVMVLVAALTGQVARADFKTNDLYIGFTLSSAQDDYIIDLGQPNVVGVGSSSVVDLSSDFSLTTFNTTFGSTAPGVSMAVMGGNTTFGAKGVFATQVRINGPGNAAVAGSSIGATHSTTQMSGGAAAVSGIMSTLIGGLPSAGNSALDSTKSYTTAETVSGLTSSFPGKTGVIPTGIIDGTSIIYEDLWAATQSTPYTYLGYFTLDLSSATAKLTFTPSGAGSSTPPVASFSGTPTSGFAPLQVVFNNTSTGSFTNSVWTFGNGQSTTNSSSSNVTNTFVAAGTYTVTLVVMGAGGAGTNVQTSYITVSPTPTIGGVMLSNGKLIFSGTNCPAGMPYRILTSTNIALSVANWTPVFTNNFLPNGTYAYTNLNTTSPSFFRLVSP